MLNAAAWVADVTVIDRAKVPVLKFVTVDGSNFDVTFAIGAHPGRPTVSGHNGIATLNVVRQFMQALPSLKPLAFILKQFLREHDLNVPYSGGLSSCMCPSPALLCLLPRDTPTIGLTLSLCGCLVLLLLFLL